MYAIADREITSQDGDPEIVFCVDEFGPLNLQPRPGRQWAAVSGKNNDPGRALRPRLRATYIRKARVRHLFAAYEPPTNSSWLHRIEEQFTALRYVTLDGTDHASHKEQASMIRRYVIWRNHAYDERLRRIVERATAA